MRRIKLSKLFFAPHSMNPLHGPERSSSLTNPETPKRELEYKFHRVLKRTYGSRRSESQTTSSFPIASAGGSGADQRNFEDAASSVSSPIPGTPTKTRSLIAELQRSSLNDDQHDDGQDPCGEYSRHGKASIVNDDDEDEPETPSKRRRSGRLEKRRSDLVADDNLQQKASTTATPPTSTPSTPTSKKNGAFLAEVSVPIKSPKRSSLSLVKASLEQLTPASSATSSSSTGSSSELALGSNSTTRFGIESEPGTTLFPKASKSGSGSVGVGPAGQTSISSFFMAKTPLKGTGLLAKLSQHRKVDDPSSSLASTACDKTDTTTNSSTNGSIPTSPFINSSSQTVSTTPSTMDPSSKKLEQLFLAFTPDRTSRSSSSSSKRQSLTKPPSSSTTKGSNRPNKQYHCPQCGMPYVRGQPEDEAIHDRYHRSAVGGIDYPGYKNEIVVARFEEQEALETNRRLSFSFGTQESEARIVAISMSDSASGGGSSFEKKKVKEIMQVVNQELGAIDFSWDQFQACKVFLYITSKKKVVGCVVAERIKQAYEIVLDPTPASPSAVTASTSPSLTTSKQKLLPSSRILSASADSSSASTPSSSSGESAIFCSTEPRKAICGINRIWVNRNYRRQGIATRMLDAVRESFIYACRLQYSDLAFSQPTGNGRALAQRYLRTEKFLVYVE